MRDNMQVLHQPVVELATDACGELADEAERHRGREYRVVQKDQAEVAEPLDATELAEEIEVCYT